MGFQENETPGVHHPEHVLPFSLPAPALGSAWAHSPSYLKILVKLSNVSSAVLAIMTNNNIRK